MPELPEVETIRRDLTELIVGRKILDIETDSSKQVKPSVEIVKKAVVGAKIKEIKRRAKMLMVHLDNSKILVFHLKLSGRLLIRKTGVPKDSWQHVVIKLKSKSEKGKGGEMELRFCDLRKFGWVKLMGEDEVKKLIGESGPEPLAALTLKKFREIL